MSSKKVLLGTAVGIAAGAVLGMLFAPAKGSAMKKRIAKTVTDYAEEVQENLSDYVDGTIEEYGSVKKGAIDLVNKTKKAAATIAGAARAR